MIVLLERLRSEPGGKSHLPLGSLFPYIKLMAAAIVRTERRGRPRTDAKSIHLTLPPDQLAALDAWASEQGDAPTRPEAVRRLVQKGLRE